LVLLSYNEREALEKLLPLIPLHVFDRVVAIDPGSTDGTLELYRNAGIPHALQPKRGRGNAFVQARDLCETQQLVFFSTDGNEDPKDLPRMLNFLNDGYDMVIAGRFVLPGSCSDNSDDPLLIRRYGSMAYSLIARVIWRTGVYDACNGFRGYNLESMKRMRLDAELHEIEIQSTIRAAKLGMRVREFPTHELPRLGGFHKATAATLPLAWRTGVCVLRELFVNP
jgi:glycosyltransferase involved in cell wall biosynthesis